MGCLGRKFKAGTGRNVRLRATHKEQFYGNGRGSQVLLDGTAVPDPLSTNVIQIPTALGVTYPVTASALPRRVVSSEKNSYLSSFTDCMFRKNESYFSGIFGNAADGLTCVSNQYGRTRPNFKITIAKRTCKNA